MSYISENNGMYMGHERHPDGDVGMTITVYNNVINVVEGRNETTYQLRLNNDYSPGADDKLHVPVDLEGKLVEDDKDYIFFRCSALDTIYPLGLKVEVKKAGSDVYEFYSIDIPYRAELITDNLYAEDFAVGENYIRICNAGCPYFNRYKKYYNCIDSDYIVYKVTLDENGVLSDLIRIE